MPEVFYIRKKRYLSLAPNISIRAAQTVPHPAPHVHNRRAKTLCHV